MKVLVTDSIHEDGLERLRELAEVEVFTGLSYKDLIERVEDFDVMIVRSATEVGKDVLDAGENLKLIIRAGVGLDNVDLDYAKEVGVKVKNTPEAPTSAVAELTLGLMLSWARDIPQADESMKEGKWIKSELSGSELKGKTLGIIGTGNIGLEVAQRAGSFNMDLLGYDVEKRNRFREIGGEYVGLEKLLGGSDYVTLHVPLTDYTHYLIGEKEFDLMKPSAVIVNVARGGVVKEEALVRALENGSIAGACIDVYEREPPEEDPFSHMSNVVLTPHIGASTIESQRRTALEVVEKLKEELK